MTVRRWTFDTTGDTATAPSEPAPHLKTPPRNELVAYRGEGTRWALRINQHRRWIYCTACEWKHPFEYGELVTIQHGHNGLLYPTPILVDIHKQAQKR